MKSPIKIFGYGSLINEESLRKTVPNASTLFPVILKNHIRIFETKSSTRFTKDNIAVCALNIKEDFNHQINGVCFEVSDKYFDDLLKREGAYNLKEIIVECFKTSEKIKAYVFVDNSKEKQEFLFEEPQQLDYLKICLDGANKFGDEFYEMFLKSTFINDKKLEEIELEKLFE